MTKTKCPIAILIPLYNGGDFVKECLNSILEQRAIKTYQVIIYDDMSTDGSEEYVEKFCKEHPENFTYYRSGSEKLWNGGSRNKLLSLCPSNAEYVLFMDCDDRLCDDYVLRRLYDFTWLRGCPDVVRLSYSKKTPVRVTTHIIDDKSPEDMVNNSKVAPWTKMVKRELVAQFPTNTLFEDVVQHIKQCDVIETVISTPFPVVEWNRCNMNSASTVVSPKRKSSAIRFIADLMDLELTKPYTNSRRLLKIYSASKRFGFDYDKVNWKEICC